MPYTVAEMVKDTKYEGFLLVRHAEQRAASSGSRYLDMTLADKTGDINAKLWDGAFAPPPVGSVVKIRGTVQEYNGRLQLRVERMRAAQDSDPVDVTQLTPCAPEAPEVMLQYLDDTISAMRSEDLQKILREMLRLAGDDLVYYPAAQKLHHAERSGLLHHTTGMLKLAEQVLTVYPFLNGDLLKAGVIIHDLSKISEMKSDIYGNVNDYTAEGLLLGHLVRGVSQVAQAAKNVGVSGEIVLLLEHMVISHHGEAEYGSPRMPMFPEAEMLHWIDLVDARMNEMQGVMRRTPQGAFSEKIWSLERRLYHPRYEGLTVDD
ncbi:MAG: HD domain-containing protein [Clostridia bacterium]|nr:HD domain-containing protein [Clostridia bacterium]